jgi:hypothetical protein
LVNYYGKAFGPKVDERGKLGIFLEGDLDPGPQQRCSVGIWDEGSGRLLWGLVNGQGQWLIAPQYCAPIPLNLYPLCAAQTPVDVTKGRFRYIDHKNKTHFMVSGDKADHFKRDLALVVEEGLWSYYDKAGNAVWRERRKQTEAAEPQRP